MHFKSNKIETWHQWEPEIDLPKEIYVDGVDAREDAFAIAFKGGEPTKKYIIAFARAILSFRSTPRKGFNLPCDQEYQMEDFSSLCMFYRVVNSKYMEWYNKNFQECADITKIVHYVFCGIDVVLEVLSVHAPTVTLQDILGAKKVKLIEDGKLVILRDISKYGCPILETQEAVNSMKFIRFLYKK